MRRWTRTGVLTCAALTLAACLRDVPAGAVGAATVSPAVPTVAAGFDYTDPDRVCRSFTAALLGHDTTTDAGPDAAHRRAAAYMGGQVAAAAAAAATGRDSRWAEWRAHRAKVVVELAGYAGEGPPDSDTTAYRAVFATTTPVGADGWRGPTRTQTVYCTLQRDGAQWRVSHYNFDTA